MRALVLERQASVDTAPLVSVERPLPQPGPSQIRVRVSACAVCRTDLHVVEGDLALRRAPIVPGHQVVGFVDAVGPGCVLFSVGERVGIAWLRETCGGCAHCVSGEENLCRNSRYTGWDEDGGYADMAIVRETFAYRIPDGFTDEEAAPLLCAGIIGYRALKRSAVLPGGRLGLFGFGSSAHLTLQVARARGCDVYVSTRGELHRRLAREMGAKWVGAATELPPVPLDGAILFAPAGEIVPPALRALRRGGTLAIAGIHLSAIPPLTYEEHLFHEKRLTSVEANTRKDGEELLAEACAIGLKPRTVPYPMVEANRALLDLKRGAIQGTGVLIAG